MASAVLTPISSIFASPLSSSSSSTIRTRTIWTSSSSFNSLPFRYSNLEFSNRIPHLGQCQFSQWNGLKNFSISTSQRLLKSKSAKKGLCRGKGAHASLFGVGAPEALVIGVVALLVFGPKGLAEVARNLGKTLRAFQPTIRELQDVSREFKTTLEREIGLDEIQSYNRNLPTSTKNTSSPSLDVDSKASGLQIDPNGSPSPSKAYSSEDLLKLTEEQLKAAATKQQEESASPGDNRSGTETPVAQQTVEKSSSEVPTDGQTQPPQDSPQEAASATPYSGKPESDT
ncbi:OLC1v1027463C1 [Oldenlandia corymbosa var. corymbosa]|uniref:OLC1v1027463C1 n=1 Tax=Oldenlandia corymbosa var. corymbosa TaxID=529605 RepID=A0AAV1CCR6_OLDCO|nr:OLC1v1027463C1 [Oldenlandia corymbosa var. corymbosa]